MGAYQFNRPSHLPYGVHLSRNWDEIFGPLPSDDSIDKASAIKSDLEAGNGESSTIETREHDHPSENDDDAPDRIVWIEIGCGRGENLLALAHRYHGQNPPLYLIGAEIHQVAVGNIFSKLDHAVNQHHAFWVGYSTYGEDLTMEQVQQQQQQQQQNQPDNSPLEQTRPATKAQDMLPPSSTKAIEFPHVDKAAKEEWSSEKNSDPYRNVRIYRGDGIKLLSTNAASHSVHRLLVTFPDPFPASSNISNRLFQLDTVQEFHRVLVPDIGLLCLATDHAGFFEWAQHIVQQHNDQQREEQQQQVCWERIENVNRMDWLPAVSAYELKGWKEGRPTFLACWRACRIVTKESDEGH